MNDLPRIFDNEQNTTVTKIIVQPKDFRWAEVLWPCMSWLVFLFNFVVALSFMYDLYMLQYDYAKHITTVVTICASYLAVAWTHRNVIANQYGRPE